MSGPIALLVVDVQVAFDDAAYWGPRNNPDCERNIARLIDGWRAQGQPVLFARHDSATEGSPLAPGTPGNAFKACITGEPDVVIRKHVNSCFYGTPDLHAWLQASGLTRLAICGITTNHCCETTARMAGNLGYETLFALDATHAFDRRGPDGRLLRADELARATAANLHGEFATVIGTSELLALLDSSAT